VLTPSRHSLALAARAHLHCTTPYGQFASSAVQVSVHCTIFEMLKHFKNRSTGVYFVSVPAPPDQTLPLVQPGVLSNYFIKTKNIPPEMSIEESLSAIPITLLFGSFYVYHLFSNC